ncbi:SDR family NAD(P)-dependent oxidoreductase [Novosphingobium piscinae]|uniref:SDR family NAD(P)-dependent oxidoreductase n=1 Tax=Novosphingobium piscinae TaxID=1507448 RepID=A0A7X1FWY1_9SPHN|nr:SDR family NAD(P)-dependent oxidoreductase [Novosphingobium piscinae]MBC2668379.1 SDR family NAD(P)-dependent oxidoreductase [Novosphingobium piscinae]
MDLRADFAAGLTVLVTGATSGFGAAMVRRVIAGGGRAIATGRRAERLAALAAELPGDRLLTVPLDVTERDCGDRLLAALPAGFAAIDVLFNNAGLALGLEPAHRTDPDDWETMIATNVAGLTRMTRAVLPGMVERGRGHVINVSSVAASYPYPGGNVYGATKAFVRQFSLNLRSDLLGTPVRVTSLEPGMCETEFSEVRFAGDKDKAAAVYAGVHALSADDVIDAVEAVLRMPAHLNVNTIEIMPVQQAFAPFAVARRG